MKNYYLEKINYYENRLSKINEKLQEKIDDVKLWELLKNEKSECEFEINFYKKRLKLLELLGE